MTQQEKEKAKREILERIRAQVKKESEEIEERIKREEIKRLEDMTDEDFIKLKEMVEKKHPSPDKEEKMKKSKGFIRLY